MWDSTNYCELNPEFESGKLEIQSNKKLTRRPITGEIRKIHLFYNHPTVHCLEGIRFYDVDGVCIYEGGWHAAFTRSWYK